MAPFRGWAVVPVIGTGTQDDPVRPDIRGAAVPGDRLEHVIEPGRARCLVAANIADATRLAAGVTLCAHDELAAQFAALPNARRNRIASAVAEFGEAAVAGDDLRALLRRVGRRLRGFELTFDPALHLTETPEPPAGSFLVETFTDTAGTQLQSHTGETGAIWTKHPNTGAPNGLINAAGRLYSDDAVDFNGQDAFYFASGIPATAEYTVAASTFMPTGGTGVNSEANLWARLSTVALTGYFVTLERNGAGSGGALGAMNMYRVSAGAFLNLGTYSPVLVEGVAGGMTHSIECLNATKKGFYQGVARITSTNNDVTAAGRAGVQVRNITPVAGGFQLESVTATDAAGGPSYQDLAGQVAGAATHAGDAALLDPLEGNQAGTSTQTGALVLVDPLSGPVAGQSDLTGNLTTLDVLEGAIAGQGGPTGDLTLGADTHVDLGGQIAGAGAQTGQVDRLKPLDGQVAGAGTQTAPNPLPVLRAIAGQVAGAGGPAGAEVLMRIGLAGTITGEGTATATLVAGFGSGSAYRGTSLQGARRAPTGPPAWRDT